MVRDDVHRYRLELVLHVAHGKDDEFVVDVHVCRAVDEAGPGALGVFGKAFDQRFGAFHAGQHEFEVGQKRRRDIGEIRNPR